MSDTFTIRQHDHGEAMTSTLLDADGAAVDLTGASVALCVAPAAGGARIVDDAAAEVTDAAAGKVSYTWKAADTEAPGTFFAQWKVTFADESVQSFPNDGFMAVRITPDI